MNDIERTLRLYRILVAEDKEDITAQIVLKALEKEYVPKQPREGSRAVKIGIDGANCGVCGSLIFMPHAYCGKCGQKINWGE